MFFRADDMGVPGNGLCALSEVFIRNNAPLCLALVPAWLTLSRWRAIQAACPGDELWCWCQHGWRHVNFEPAGTKKREFGSARPARDKRQDIAKGFQRLSDILGRDFTAVFCPPWNRCDGESMAAMPGLGLKGLSRTKGAGPEPPAALPDFPVCVDLHTRKEPDGEQSLDNLLRELEEGLADGHCGVMIHHQRMNALALAFLEMLIACLARMKGVEFVHFGHLLA